MTQGDKGLLVLMITPEAVSLSGHTNPTFGKSLELCSKILTAYGKGFLTLTQRPR